MRLTILGIVLPVAMTLAAAPSQRVPSVADVMKRVGAYVDGYGERAAIVVATEHYTQTANRAAPSMPESRRIVAEFAIVKLETARGWQGFRDVVEVDGTPLPDREDR